MTSASDEKIGFMSPGRRQAKTRWKPDDKQHAKITRSGWVQDVEDGLSEELIAKAQRIFSPYGLEVKEIPWWSVYEIGQRLCREV